MTRITFSNNLFIRFYPYYLLPFSQCCLFLSFSSVMLKRSVFTPILNKGNAEECSNYHKIALISHASKVMLKILQPRLQQYMKQELLDVQAELEKGRGKIANIHRTIEKARELQKKKKSTSVSLTMLKPLTLWITTNCGKFFKRWQCQTTLPAS